MASIRRNRTSSAGRPITAYEGVSQYRNRSDAGSLHEAIQDAAEAAAADLGLGPRQYVDFEVSRIQIVVGNPNVKVYRVEITQTG